MVCQVDGGGGGGGLCLKLNKYNNMILRIALIYYWAFATKFGRLNTEMKTQD